MKTFAVFAAVGFLACAGATPTPYQAADVDGFGYSEFVRADGVVVVTYRGNMQTALPNVERFAMCRAAEVVAGLGKPLFAIVDRQSGATNAGAYTHCVPGYGTTTTCNTYGLSRPIVTLAVRPVADATEAGGAVYTAGSSFTKCQRARASAD